MSGPRIGISIPGVLIFICLLLFICLLPLAASARARGKTAAGLRPNVSFTLVTGIAKGKMVFIGKGGEIDGQFNPDLRVHEGDRVQITLINGERAEHDIVLPDVHARSHRVVGRGASSALVFHAADIGTFAYFCSVPGHREAGMEGLLKVEPGAPEAAPEGVSIARDPSDLPPPLPDRAPKTVRINLEAVERTGHLADNTTYQYWTFNGKVPGPFLRVRVGDTVAVSLKNAASSVMIHNVDLHAVRGPGGGGVASEAAPGETKSFSFKATAEGLYVYHCSVPVAANHISNGMYGLILVEPPGGLPKADREFYVMQGELYTTGPYGQHGAQEFSYDKLVGEHPEYFVFNGSVGALTKEHPLRAKTGETIRIFFGVGGPNFTSSFHIIGTIFDRVYATGSLSSPPLTSVQTIAVAPGSAAIVELSLPVPGHFLLADHSMSRMERGLAGTLIVEGYPAPELFRAGEVGEQPAKRAKAATP